MHKRREFIKKLAMLSGSLMLPLSGIGGTKKDKWGEILPLRKLGKTGVNVTMLGLGGYHVGWTTEKDSQEVIEKAIEGGVRFFDTAESYGNGQSEARYGSDNCKTTPGRHFEKIKMRLPRFMAGSFFRNS